MILPRIRGTRHRGCGTRSRALTRGCFIFPRGCGMRIAHAKVAKVGKGFQIWEGGNAGKCENEVVKMCEG